MKVSAALQILTTVMSGTASADDWPAGAQHAQQAPELLPRVDLDLGACLDVETLQELHHSLDTPCPPSGQADSAWVDNVIDMTSSSPDLTSSGDHASAGIVPNVGELSGGLPSGQGLSGMENFDFAFMEEEEDFSGTDNATFLTMDVLTSAAAAIAAGAGAGGDITAMDTANIGECSVLDFAQFGSLSSAALTSSTTTSTIDLTALEHFVTLDSAHTTQSSTSNNNNNNNNNNDDGLDSVGDLSNSNSIISNSNSNSISNSISNSSSSSNLNLPSTLWNVDLVLPGPEEGASSRAGLDVKATLKSRLHSRGSLHSLSQDSDLMTSCSLRSPASSTSSLTQSMEEEDTDDPVKMLEKREKNRLAAQKCRNRKRDKADNLQKNVARLEERQEKLKAEVRKLRDERETLEEIVNIHSIVCPKIRKLSSASNS